jgi:protoporphyrinogen oxidase
MAAVVVLGAGPAGLAAAWLAARRGHDVTVLERASRPGGLAASFEVAGQRVDHGSHRLHPSIDPAILAEVERLLDGDLQVRPRHGRIRLEGRWIGFPLRAADLVRRLPPSFAARAVRDAALRPLRRPTDDSFAAVIRAGLGPTVAESFYFPYMRKIWAVEPDDLAGELARRRVGTRSPAAVVRRLVRGTRPEGRTFLYPRLGFGQIVERLAGAAVAAGVDLRLDREVDAVDVERRQVRAGADTVEADHVWSTVPLAALARLADPAPPQEVLAAAGRLTSRAAVLVYLVLDRPRYTEFDAHYFPAGDTPLSRLSEPKNYRDGPDPADRTVLCAELPCSVGDGIWSSEPAALGDLVAGAVEREGLPPLGGAAVEVEVEVRRAPHVYPVYRRGFEWDAAAVELWAAAQPGLLTFGRHGLFAHDNTHHALATGWAAAAALGADGRFDGAAWAVARRGFRDHVVED